MIAILVGIKQSRSKLLLELVHASITKGALRFME